MDITSINRFVKNGLLPTHTLGLMGNHGIGKTTYIHKTFRQLIADKHNIPLERVHVISRCVSIMDPADLIGNFQEFGGRTYNCPPSWIPTCKAYDDKMAALYAENGMTYSRLTEYDDIYILFLDECKRGNTVIQDGIMELLLEHRLFGVDLKENTYVVCADNDNAKIYNGSRRDPAQESRIKNFTFAPTDKEYLEDYRSRVESGEIHEAVYEFLNKFPEFIVLPTKTIEELSIQGKKGPSPRDWTQLGQSLNEFRRHEDDIVNGDKAFLADVAASYVGFSYALKFADFCEVERKHEIDVKKVLNSMTDSMEKRIRDEFMVNPKAAVTTSHSLLELLKQVKTLSAKQGKNILTFLTCCPNEAIAAFVKGWQKNNMAQFKSWRTTPKRYKIYNEVLMSKDGKNGGCSAFDSWLNVFMSKYRLSIEDMDSDTITIED